MDINRIFVSYSFNPESKNAADAFIEIAEGEGYEVVTGYDPESNSPTQTIRSRILASDCFAAIMSVKPDGHSSAGKASGWVYNEIGMAYAWDLPLIICKEKSIEDVGLAKLTTMMVTFDANDLSSFKIDVQRYLRNHRDQRDPSNPRLSELINGLVMNAFKERRPNHPVKVTDRARAILEEVIGQNQDDNLLRIYTKSPILREILHQLNSFLGLEAKFGEEREKKIALGKAFAKVHGQNIKYDFDEIFIESGSTLAPIARAIADCLPTESDSQGGRQPRVRTNNAIAYLYLWLCRNVICDPVPEGPLDERYAGMFGRLTELDRDADYKDPLGSADKDGLMLAKKLSDQILTQKPPRCLILAAASGFQVSGQVNAVQINRTTGEHHAYDYEPVLAQLKENCRGLHVGSYVNHLFKRALFQTGAPMIVFLHDKKVDCDVDVGRCHFLFVSSGIADWLERLENHPLSFWIACDRSSYLPLQKKFSDAEFPGNWEYYVYNEASAYPIVIGHNEVFRLACKNLNFSPYRRTLSLRRETIDPPSSRGKTIPQAEKHER